MSITGKRNNKNRNIFAGLAFAGCLFLGVGIGIWVNRMEEGFAIGIGFGFLAMGLIWYNRKK